MIEHDRKNKEHKSIIVRTRKGNTVGCYHFMTHGRNAEDIPSACTTYVSYDKFAERIEVSWNMGGDVFITLYETLPTGITAKETVVFDKEYVTFIDIQTDFKNLR